MVNFLGTLTVFFGVIFSYIPRIFPKTISIILEDFDSLNVFFYMILLENIKCFIEYISNLIEAFIPESIRSFFGMILSLNIFFGELILENIPAINYFSNIL